MKLLLSVDNSDHSTIAINDVAGGLWPPDSEVLVTTAVWNPFGSSSSTEVPQVASSLVETAAEKVRANRFVKSVDTKVVIGNPKKEILSLLEEQGFDLLVMGSRKPSMKKMLFGSVSHALLLSSPCSVRISRKQVMKIPRRVILAFDGSEFCWRALNVMATRQVPEGTDIYIVNAVPTLEESSYDNPDVFSMDQLERGRNRLLQIAQDGLVKAAEELRAKLPHCNVSYKILNGHPRETLIAACAEYDADIIFIGTQGRNFSAYLAIGSVSEAVAVGAPCTVEVVKPPRRP